MTTAPAPYPTLANSDTDEPKVAHYARSADITRAMVTGEAIQALCGKVWVPTRAPDAYPVCQPCAERLRQLAAALGN